VVWRVPGVPHFLGAGVRGVEAQNTDMTSVMREQHEGEAPVHPRMLVHWQGPLQLHVPGRNRLLGAQVWYDVVVEVQPLLLRVLRRNPLLGAQVTIVEEQSFNTGAPGRVPLFGAEVMYVTDLRSFCSVNGLLILVVDSIDR
jgi:hypothetical protein